MPRRTGPASLAKKLGARIRVLREAAGVTQEKLAWDCDLDKGFMSQVESGKRMPSVPVIFQLADRLGVEAADIVAVGRGPRLRLLDASRGADGAAVRDALARLQRH